MVSGIELPADPSEDAKLPMDAAVDMAQDATPPDAMVLDLGPDAALDLGPDADLDWALPPDMMVDMAVPDAGVLEPRTLAGRWHLYGISGAQGVFEATLVITVVGSAHLETIDGEVLEVSVALDAIQPAPLVAVGLGPYSDRVEGVLDALSGAGVLVAPDATAFATREQVPRPEALLEAGYYAHAFFPADPGAGQFGVLGLLPDSTGYVEASRQADSGEELDRLVLSIEPATNRHVLVGEDTEGVPIRRVLTPIRDGRGALGLTRRGESEWGVSMLWNSQPVGMVPDSGRWFCGGIVRDGGGAVTRRRMATVEGDELIWDGGGRAVLVPEQGTITVAAESEPFFEHDVVMSIPGPDGRLWALFDRDAAGGVGWGFALCVRAEL
jgi:hypothetical protein